MNRNLKTLAVTALVAALCIVTWNLRAQILPAPLGPYGNLGFTNTAISTTPVTLTANQMLGVVTFSNAGAVTWTTDTAANICNMFPFAGNSVFPYAYDLYVKSTGAGGVAAPTLGTGVTLTGTGTAATVTVRHFKVILTTCPVPGTGSPTAAVNLFSLETTAF